MYCVLAFSKASECRRNHSVATLFEFIKEKSLHLKPIILVLSYGYRYNCIQKTNPVIFEQNFRLKIFKGSFQN